MKINFICHSVSGSGGIETVLTKVLNHYAKEHEITLTLKNKPENENWLKTINKNVTIKIPSQKSKLGRRLFCINTIIHSKDDENLVLLGANMIKMASLIRKIFHKKFRIISWIHFSLFEQNLFNEQNILFADYHLAISSKIKNELIEMGVSQKHIKLIYNPIERNNVRKIDKLNNEITFIGHTQFEGQKNLKELINGLKKTHDMHLSVIGTEKMIKLLKIILLKKAYQKELLGMGGKKTLGR